VAVIAGIFLVLYVGIYLWSLAMPPVQPVSLISNPDPAATFEEAMARFEALLAEEEARGDIDPKCLPFQLNHGQKTARTIVLLHGLTACPFQYHELAQLYFDQGYNVLVPRLPRHGLADRTSNALADLTAEELLGVMDPSLDIAAGLGDQVAMFGLSLGANVAAAAGQLRLGLHLAVPTSPAIGLRFTWPGITPALTRIVLGLPDMYIWWDPIHKAEFQAESGYPGFSSRALGQIWRLGLAVQEAALDKPPLADKLEVITNWGDPAINLANADILTNEWRRNGGDLSTYRFALVPWLPHDIISTDAVGANTELTYPVLLEQVDEHF
jgi:pimeloyl-ACP methyl ester carboxylesterase